MEQTGIIPKLLPPGTHTVLVKGLCELNREESALRHRLELLVERAFYRAAVALQELSIAQLPDDETHYDRNVDWRNSEKVKRAFEIGAAALRELRTRGLYHSTHHSFDDYVRERFGSFIEEYSPAPSVPESSALTRN